MAKIQVFLDSDVIISSLLSKTGASFEIIRTPKVEKIISKFIEGETREVSKRLKIKEKSVKKGLQKIGQVSISLTKEEIVKKYKRYVFHGVDSHVIAGAHKSKSKFLLTHNIKHYKINKIRNELEILVLKPGNFLQYLRSVDKS
ncbi:MAG: hypothetical protein A3A51_04605 [Candidatus Levybacteria bacterium RIFCSPLOWO2_01_FULL_39_10]|nr:MAG: hypothetical protein A3A51_04605 [Candidatus Levybacteria bacterium RIFCSPLOWO2_01_FULL_39_10]